MSDFPDKTGRLVTIGGRSVLVVDDDRSRDEKALLLGALASLSSEASELEPARCCRRPERPADWRAKNRERRKAERRRRCDARRGPR